VERVEVLVVGVEVFLEAVLVEVAVEVGKYLFINITKKYGRIYKIWNTIFLVQNFIIQN